MDSLRKQPIKKPPLKVFSSPILPQIKAQPLPQTPPRERTLNSLRKNPYPSNARSVAKTLPKKSTFKMCALIVFRCIIAVIIGICIFFAWRVYAVSKQVHISSAQQDQDTSSSTQSSPTPFQNIQAVASSLLDTDTTQLKSDSAGRINILLLGRAGEHHSGKNLTDTIMMMSIDTKTKKIGLLSLPRDLYVQIPGTKISTKINAVYQHGLQNNQGIELIQKSVQDITAQNIHYVFIIDFAGFEKVVDAIGGIHVEVMRDIYDARYPGPNYSYETFEIKKGWHMLNGATALKYVRERHDDPEGDFGRAKRQQQVIQAVKNTVFSLNTFTNVIALNKLLTILGDSVKTTINSDEISSFITLSKQADTQNISNVVIDAWKPESLLRVSHVMVGETRMFTLIPRVGNYSEIQDIASNIFSIDILERRKESIANEKASITIINRSSNQKLTPKLRKILREDLGFKHSFIEIGDSSTLSETLKENLLLMPSNQNDSFILDNIGKKKPFSLDELMKKLTLKLPPPSEYQDFSDPYDSDFTLIIGNSLGKELDFEEATPEDFKQFSENESENL